MKNKSAIDIAASQLRSIVLAAEEGALIGSEEGLIEKLGVSRATVRQVARLLEREGLLRVRRGINGGYFGTRPDIRVIETSVSAYLELVHTNPEDITSIASALWVEVVRRAAALKNKKSKAFAAEHLQSVRALRSDASFYEVLHVDEAARKAMFQLISSPYIELIFQINTAFSRRHFTSPSKRDHTQAHKEFVPAWQNAKILELETIADGNVELAVIAARYERSIWHRRIWNHDTA
jgi:DNA-binding FadR family transcriptional regulator